LAEVVYPNVWGPGQLFAFSGFDGDTDWFHPFVGTTLDEDLGFLFHLKVPRRLWCEPTSLAVSELTARVVTGDCVEFSVRFSRGASFPLRYLFLDCFTVVGETSTEMPPQVRAEGSALVSRGENVTTHSSVGEHTSLVTEAYGARLFFAFSFSPTSDALATDQARKALEANLAGLQRRKLLFYSTLPSMPDASDRRRRTAGKAVSVLRANLMGPQGFIPYRWTTPDRWPHQDLWLWDACFGVFGYRVFSPDVASEVLEAMLSSQHPDGFIAHRTFPTGMSEIASPPLLAWTCYQLVRFTTDDSLAAWVYPQLVRFVEWVLTHRRADGSDLLSWRMNDDPRCRCDESGMDNSPRFDRGLPLEAVDLNAYVVGEMKSLADLATIIDRGKESREWKARAADLADAVNTRLWDDAEGFYFDREVGGERVSLKTSAGFLPMWAGIPDRPRARRLVQHLMNPDGFWTAFPVPSVARNEPSYRRDMWRGPTWLNIDLLIVFALREYGLTEEALQLTDRVLSGVEHWYGRLGSIYEFYDPDGQTPPTELDRKERLTSGEGIAPVRDYSWSAACYLALATGTL